MVLLEEGVEYAIEHDLPLYNTIDKVRGKIVKLEECKVYSGVHATGKFILAAKVTVQYEDRTNLEQHTLPSLYIKICPKAHSIPVIGLKFTLRSIQIGICRMRYGAAYIPRHSKSMKVELTCFKLGRVKEIDISYDSTEPLEIIKHHFGFIAFSFVHDSEEGYKY